MTNRKFAAKSSSIVASVKAAVASSSVSIAASQVSDFVARLLSGESAFLWNEEEFCTNVRNAAMSGIDISAELQELEEEAERLQFRFEKTLKLKESTSFMEEEFEFRSGDGRHWVDQLNVPVCDPDFDAHRDLCYSAEFRRSVLLRQMAEALEAYANGGSGWMLSLREWYNQMNTEHAAYQYLKEKRWVFDSHHDYDSSLLDEFTIIFKDGGQYTFALD